MKQRAVKLIVEGVRHLPAHGPSQIAAPKPAGIDQLVEYRIYIASNLRNDMQPDVNICGLGIVVPLGKDLKIRAVAERVHDA